MHPLSLELINKLQQKNKNKEAFHNPTPLNYNYSNPDIYYITYYTNLKIIFIYLLSQALIQTLEFSPNVILLQMLQLPIIWTSGKIFISFLVTAF